MRATTSFTVLALSFGMATLAVAEGDALMKQAQALFQPVPLEPPAVKGIASTPAMVDLGKDLYFDPRLSQSHNISCNTCHQIGLGGVDALPTSIGHKWQKGGRNAPTVLDAVFNIAQFWDGRAEDLKAQAGGPIQNPIEMGITHEHAIEMLRGIPGYAKLFAAAGAGAIDLGVLPDTRERVIAALEEASCKFDAVVVSGGASQGQEDHVVRSIDTLGKRHFWQIAIKPGRPMSFGQIDNCVILGLPGNPVAAFVCFLMYVRPVLTRLAGGAWPEPVRYPVPAGFTQKKKKGRREFWRARLAQEVDGRLVVTKFPRDGSGLISSFREADGLIEVAEDVEKIRTGEFVNFIPFSEFGLG